jgi:ribosomal protein S18 acetylase RimI-like enzyme
VLAGVKDSARNTLGAETSSGKLVAAGWVDPSGKLGITTGGKVHPDFRRQGLGTRLLEWAECRAGELLQHVNPNQMVITNEALSEGAQRLYLARGYTLVMEEEMRVGDLTRPFPGGGFPEGINLASWSPDMAIQFYQAYYHSFQDRPGFPSPSADDWINGNNEFDGFRPTLSVLARYLEEPVGFLTADVYSGLGWISQIGVVPAWRRKGLAKALIIEALRRFSDEGFKQVALHVNINNPSAINLYAQLGFTVRLKRARFVKVIKSPFNPDLL